MAQLLTYRGREVTHADATFLRELIAHHPGASRRALSRLACAAWNWVQPNGAPRDMVCRGLMLALHRAGHVVLPAPRYIPANPLAQRCKPVPVAVAAEPLRAALKDLLPLTFRQVRRTAEEVTFNGLIQAHHYLGYTQPVGEHLKYLVYSRDQRLLACLATRWPSPITPGSSWKPAGEAEPVGQLITLLAVSVGIPFFVLSTTGPLLQKWSVISRPGRSPYRLYALSNAGSLVGLLGYPFLVEPFLGIRDQALAWSGLFSGLNASLASQIASDGAVLLFVDNPSRDDYIGFVEVTPDCTQ